jgi:hypothetical protein
MRSERDWFLFDDVRHVIARFERAKLARRRFEVPVFIERLRPTKLRFEVSVLALFFVTIASLVVPKVVPRIPRERF